MTSADIEDLCRTCLRKNNVLYPMFGTCLEITHNGIYSLADAITSVTGLKINNNVHPGKICEDCKAKAAIAFSFRKMATESDVYINELLKKKEPYKLEDKVGDFKIEIQSSDDDFDNRYQVSGTLDNTKETFATVPKIEPIECYNVNIETEALEIPENDSSIRVRKDARQAFCPLCRVTYKDLECLTKHMWEVHADIMGPKKRGRPKKINTEFILKNLVDRGLLKRKNEEKMFGCSFCVTNFVTKEELIRHIVAHEDKIYSCAACKKRYLKKKFYENHLCEKKKTEEDAGSSELTVVLPSGPVLTSFPEWHLENTEKDCVLWRECTSCSLLVSTPDELVAHVDAAHPNSSLKCPQCNKVFENLPAARAHRGRCANVERTFTCASCPQRFTREALLNKHILACHAGQEASVQFLANSDASKRYQCDFCKQYFLKKASLTKHLRHHSVNKHYKCTMCDKSFHRNDNLKSHMRVHGIGTRTTSSLCLYCGRSFSCSSNFIVHMRRHTGDKPYKCDFCEKGFPRSSDLQTHRRMHTGEKPYACEVCHKAFSRSNKLSRHMRVHTGARPYKCTYCDKGFSQSNDLNLHVRRHTGDKPYVCEVCGERFIQGTGLQIHRRNVGHFKETPALQPSTQASTSVLTQTISQASAQLSSLAITQASSHISTLPNTQASNQFSTLTISQPSSQASTLAFAQVSSQLSTLAAQASAQVNAHLSTQFCVPSFR